MDFYIFEDSLPLDNIIVADPDPSKICLCGPWKLVDQFSEGQSEYPAAMEAQIKQEIQASGYYLATGPNFFDHATSERCQDAFVSWLIIWARDDHCEIN